VQFDQLALLLALVFAVNVVLLIALQLPRIGRRGSRGMDAGGMNARVGGALSVGDTDHPATAVQVMLASAGLPTALYQRMTRVVTVVFIGSAVVIVALTGTPNALPIIVLLMFSLLLIELFQDVLPVSALGRLRLPVEAAVVLIFLTVLVAMTGGQGSPYFFGYILVVGGAALSTSEGAAATLAIISSLAYLAAVIIASNSDPLASADVGVVAFNLVSIALVMYVGAVIGREHRRARDAALKLSRFDSLTGLLTSSYFTIAVEQEVLRATRTNRPFAIIQVDLDGMKSANDRFGLEAGDQLIREAADAIRGAVRATDVVARNSGGADEFFVMLPETDAAGADVVAENIRANIANVALSRNVGLVRSTASIGVASFPEDGRTWVDLKNRANFAEREAKVRGGNQVVRFDRTALPTTVSTRVPRRPYESWPEQTGRTPERQMEAVALTVVPDPTPGPAPWDPR
jgi:diguanylate cyclase (GGDEF)-like protein